MKNTAMSILFIMISASLLPIVVSATPQPVIVLPQNTTHGSSPLYFNWSTNETDISYVSLDGMVNATLDYSVQGTRVLNYYLFNGSGSGNAGCQTIPSFRGTITTLGFMILNWNGCTGNVDYTMRFTNGTLIRRNLFILAEDITTTCTSPCGSPGWEYKNINMEWFSGDDLMICLEYENSTGGKGIGIGLDNPNIVGQYYLGRTWIPDWTPVAGDAGINITTNHNLTLTELSDGTHYLTLWLNDSSNNMNSSTVYFSTETVYPVLAYNSDTTSATNLSRDYIFINVSLTEANLDTIRYSHNGTNYTDWDGNDTVNYWKNLTGLDDGNHNISAWVNDTANNMDSVALRTITLDNTAPQLVIQSPTNTSYTTSSVSLNWQPHTGIDNAYYSLSGAANVSLFWSQYEYTSESWSPSDDDGTYPYGLWSNGTYIWITDPIDSEVSLFFPNGTYAGTKWSTTSCGLRPYDITSNGTYIWIMENPNYAGGTPGKVCWFGMDGTYIGNTFATPVSSYALTMNDEYFYVGVTNSTEDNIYKYYINGTWTGINWTVQGFPTHETVKGLETDGTYIYQTDSYTYYVYIYWLNGTYSDSFINTATADISGITISGDDMWISSPFNSVKKYAADKTMKNVTMTVSDGNANVVIWADDIVDNANSSTVHFTVDTDAPDWSSNSSSIPSIFSPTTNLYFNMTWSEITSSMNVSIIETNISGSPVNYTMTVYSESVYNHTFSCPKVGDYYWKVYANDSVGLLNVTDTWDFSIAIEDTLVDIYINGSKNTDKSISQGQTWNITAYSNVTTLNVTLYIDSVLQNYSLGYVVNISEGVVGDYNVSVYVTGNENYTGTSREQTLSVVGVGTPTYSDIKEEYPTPPTFSYSRTSQLFNCSWEWNATLANLSSVILDFNGTNTTVTVNRSIGYGSAEFYHNITSSLKAGTYNYTWYANNSAGNLGATPIQIYIVSKATPTMTISAVSWTVYVNDPTTVTGAETNNGDSDCSYVLKVDGVIKSNPYSVTYGLAGIRSYNYSVVSCENYTAYSTARDLSVLERPVGSGGTGTDIIIIIGEGNWSIIRPDFIFIMSPNSHITRSINIDNRLDEEITMDDVELACIPAACAPDTCIDICEYMVFGNEVYSSGVPGEIPQGQTGEINLTIDLTESYIEMMGLDEVTIGTHAFSIDVEINDISQQISGSVSVYPGLDTIGESFDWLTDITVLIPGEDPVFIPNWLIASISIIIVMVSGLFIIKWVARRKPKKRSRIFDIYR